MILPLVALLITLSVIYACLIYFVIQVLMSYDGNVITTGITILSIVAMLVLLIVMTAYPQTFQFQTDSYECVTLQSNTVCQLVESE